MNVTVEIGERSFAVPPFMLADLEAAAPHIDRMNELKNEIDAAQRADPTAKPTMTQAFKLTRALVDILAIGIANCPDPLTADEIAKQVNWSFMGSLQTAVDALLRSSGLDSKGEAKAPKARAAKGARA